MKLRRVVALVCFAIGFSVAASSVATETRSQDSVSVVDARQQVLALGKEWAEAEDKHDGQTLRRILDDKFIATFGTHQPHDKGSFIQAQLRGEVDPTVSQTLTDETVVIDQDTAIVVGTDTLRGTRNGVAYTRVGRYTATYIRRQGKWVALAEHLAEEPQAK